MPYKDPEKAKEAGRKRTAKYRKTENGKVKIKQYLLENKQQSLEYGRKYRHKNRDKINARRSERKDWVKQVAYNKIWRTLNPEKIKSYDPPDKQHNRSLRKRYGITLEKYNEILDAQNGVCASCSLKPIGKRSTLNVDHDHNTGKIRALLCHSCNTALGLLRDDAQTVEKLLEYIKHYG